MTVACQEVCVCVCVWASYMERNFQGMGHFRVALNEPHYKSEAKC